jgi:RimJ/RimL family protein N-acetyltransferase
MAEATVNQPEIVTERLRLRRLRPRDAGLIALYASDARVARATAWIPHPYPPGAAKAFVERTLSPAARERVWALDTGADDENGLIGLISLKPGDEGEAEIGYWVAPAFWNTGYASEAVEGLVGQAAEAGWTTLLADVFQDNPASTRVLVHAGFDYVGDGEIFSLARGGMVPTFRYRRELGGAA